MAIVISKIAQVSKPISRPLSKPSYGLPVIVFLLAMIATMLIFTSL